MKISTVHQNPPFFLHRTPSKLSTATTIRPFSSKDFLAAINSFLKCEQRCCFELWNKLQQQHVRFVKANL